MLYLIYFFKVEKFLATSHGHIPIHIWKFWLTQYFLERVIKIQYSFSCVLTQTLPLKKGSVLCRVEGIKAQGHPVMTIQLGTRALNANVQVGD